MIEPMLIAGLLELVKDVGAGLLSPDVFARRLLDLAAQTGIAPMLLAEYLTDAGTRRAELVADIAEESKLAVKRMGG